MALYDPPRQPTPNPWTQAKNGKRKEGTHRLPCHWIDCLCNLTMHLMLVVVPHHGNRERLKRMYDGRAALLLDEFPPALTSPHGTRSDIIICSGPESGYFARPLDSTIPSFLLLFCHDLS